MSQRKGDKARFFRDRHRKVLRRKRVREALRGQRPKTTRTRVPSDSVNDPA